MPLYDVRCTECGRGGTLFRIVAERDNLPYCECGGDQIRIISAPMLAPMFEPYLSPVTEQPITSKAAQREDLARHGKILYEPGLKEDIARNRERAKEKAFEPIAEAVDNYVREAVVTGKLET